MRNRIGERRRNGGAAMVEMAITIAVFMTLLLAIFEFALLLFSWTRGVEATRAGARLAVVSAPVIPASPDGEASVNCGTADCGDIFDRMQRILPELQPENVTIRYRASAIGDPERPVDMALFDVRVAISGVTRQLAVPGILGVPLVVPMPGFATTRISEDLHTPGNG